MDNYDSKWELFILPAIALLIYLLMWWLERNPQLYNFPSSKKHSRKEQEKNGVELISWLKVITVLMFVLIEILMITNPYLVLWAALPFITLLLYVCIKYVNRLICRKKYVSLHIINNEWLEDDGLLLRWTLININTYELFSETIW